MSPIFKCVIPGRTFIKKNQQRVFGYGKHKKVVYTSKFRMWEREALRILTFAKKDSAIEIPVFASFRFYFLNHHAEADVSNCVEGIADCLQKAQVIKNDRLIYKFQAEKFFNEEPRTEVELYEFENKGA